MYKSDCRLESPQTIITITFKNFNELWIYGIAIKLRRKLKIIPEIKSGDISNLAPLLNLMSLFSNSSNISQKMKNLKTIKTPESKQTDSVISREELSIPESSQSSAEQMCKCLCHKNSNSSDESSDHLLQYIDKRFSDLEKSIDNKFASLENKMLSLFNLFINK